MQYNKREILPYMVGGLLYTPATRKGIVDKLKKGAYRCLTSMAFCLEDSINDDALESAESELKCTLKDILEDCNEEHDIPLIFIRIRSPEHLQHIHVILGEYERAITGYILPKFDLENANEYAKIIKKYNQECNYELYIMPILESKSIANINSRMSELNKIKAVLDDIRPYVLNVRVGGNDFSNQYGLRRSFNQSIYDIGVIRDILVDIINVFSSNYVVSGPVWEYFDNGKSNEWSKGLMHELELDRLNGFIGKTAIHPSQLPLIYDSMKVNRNDYEDAIKILNWVPETLAVEKSSNGSRMNEVKCHLKWAIRISMLGSIYGLKGE